MKKIFFCVVMFLLVLNVHAVKDEYSEWSLEYPSGIPKNVIESEDRYKWYKEEILDIEYLKKEDIYNKQVDYDDYKTYESEELLIEPIKLNDRTIIKEYKDYKFESDNINYVVLTNNNSNSIIGITEVIIYDNKGGTKIDYSVLSEYSYLYDNDKNKHYPLQEGKSIYINLNKEYNADDVRIFLYYYSSSSNNKLSISYNTFKDYPLYTRDASLFKCDPYCELTNIGIKDMIETSRTYKLNVYKYIDKLYKTYSIKKIYADDYYSNLEGYIKDESTKKIFYRYIKYKMVIYKGNEIVESFKECGKSSCIVEFVEIEYPKEEIPPKTYDGFNIILVIIPIIIILLIVFYIIKCRKKSYD